MKEQTFGVAQALQMARAPLRAWALCEEPSEQHAEEGLALLFEHVQSDTALRILSTTSGSCQSEGT